MSTARQVFQTNSRWRWKIFLWTSRILLSVVALMIPAIIITLAIGIKPELPQLLNDASTARHLINPVKPQGMNERELRKYKGFESYLNSLPGDKKLDTSKISLSNSRIRAAFYVDWDPQAFYSLQQNIGKLNMVIPEWFFIDPATDTLKAQIDTAALNLMKKHKVKIIALLNNINQQKAAGEFDGNMLHRILHSREKKERLINDIVKYLRQFQLAGINIDFEEFTEKSDDPIIAFQRELYEKLHPNGFLVSQDIMPINEDFNGRELSKYNDYMLLMAYDEHYGTSVAGAISSQRWIEKVLDETAREIPSEKIILCVACYGYDWPAADEATIVTYQQALAKAKQYKARVDFNNDTYNNCYQYTETDGTQHKVYFTDAATNFNTIRFADEYGTAGTALWRLGSEDDRLWKFYGRSLTNYDLQKQPYDFALLENIEPLAEKPDYIGEGEVLNVVSVPERGKIRLEIDPQEKTIAEQIYLALPTKYVIQKYGNVHHQVVLTFDDGPDPRYTTQILDVLRKEKVPAVFFIVGIAAENNLPLLNRIYADGHEIGNHTFTHPNMALVSLARATAEMESTRLLIEAVTGKSTVLFRAPYNADAEPTSNVELRPIALSKQKNYYEVGESIDPNDWEKNVTADSIYQRVVRQYENNPTKGIILLHDAGGDRQATVDALPRIISYFKARGIQFTTLSNLLHVKREVLMPPSRNSLVNVDGGIASFGFWFGNFISTAFWLAILLGLGRIIIMGIMAGWQKLRSNKYRAAFDLPLETTPPVTIIVPAYNEEINAVKTIQNLLEQDYPSLEIIFVDDGSRDNTYQKVLDAFCKNTKVIVLAKPNGGKASALNYGISKTKSEYIVCIDADTQLKADAVTQLMKRMLLSRSDNVVIGAVAGNVKVGNQDTLLTKWQSLEYTTAQNFDRRAFDLINGITVVPGAIGAFRKAALEKAGGFTTDTLAEDCDLTIRILRNGYRVVNCNEAIAITEAPETLKQFMKQRFRWSYGIMQAFWKNKDACFNRKYKGLGLIALPNILIFQIILPLLSPLADLMLLISLIWSYHNPENFHKIGVYYLIFLTVDVLVSVIAFAFEKEKFNKLIWLLPQRFAYRQMMYIVLFRAIKRALEGESQGWGALKRTGNVKQIIAIAS